MIVRVDPFLTLFGHNVANSSLLHQGHPLAVADSQLAILARVQPSFDSRLAESGHPELQPAETEILQVNVGKLCNMTCDHCHVDAGPDRREVMTREVANVCLSFLRANPSIHTLDLTGGAPEMNPHFKHFVTEARSEGRHVIDRCNLTILQAPGFDDLPEFLADQQVEIVASLPCYLEENTDAQRGDGAFSKSVATIRRLNELGYGVAESSLKLTLVYNPVGPSLPPDQQALEDAYRRELKSRYDIEFTRLFTITNMPISRFLDALLVDGRFNEYMQKLIDAYNPAAINGLMCRNTLSVGWDGTLFDCDFNQMLELPISNGKPFTIFDVASTALAERNIRTGTHCFGCTAGAGSGCQGSIAS